MTGFGSSCGACKFLRRKCSNECVFVPYFCYDEAATHFAAVHKVFGASNASKLLLHLPVHNRRDAATSISYEALARMRDPIYGCVAHIFALQQQVAFLQKEIEVLGNQIANNNILTNGVASCGSSDEATHNNNDNSFSGPQLFPQNDVIMNTQSNQNYHTGNGAAVAQEAIDNQINVQVVPSLFGNWEEQIVVCETIPENPLENLFDGNHGIELDNFGDYPWLDDSYIVQTL
ncbi:hypothetical protein UlMin_024142 [Ulmus minor]